MWSPCAADEPSPFQPLSDETQVKKEENKDELLVPPGQEQGKTAGKPETKGKKKNQEPKESKDNGKGDKDKKVKRKRMKRKSPKNFALTSTASPGAS